MGSPRVEVVDGALTRELRRRVLRPHLGLDDALPGDDVPQAVHLAAIDGDAIVGTCFVYAEPCHWLPDRSPAWRLKQMATDPDRRGAGIGAAVLALAHTTAREHGARLLWCHARESAARFYAANGWQAHGEVFLDPDMNLPHRHMSIDLEGPSSSEPPHGFTSSAQ